MENNQKKSKEEIQFENEFLKLKLQGITGAKMMETSDKKLPEELENAFLKNVLAFEEAYTRNEEIRIYEILGKPAFKPYAEACKGDLALETEAVLEIYESKNINVDHVYDVNEKDYYIFLTEELPEHMTNDLKIPGWTNNFIYEEFHPNDREDIQKIPSHFLFELFTLEEEWFTSNLGDTMNGLNEEKIIKEAAIKKLNNFRHSYQKFSKPKVKILEAAVDGKTGSLTAEISYKAYLDGKPVLMKGPSSFSFTKNKNDYWQITRLRFPGFNL